jgi:predicted amidohydrolase
MICLWLALLAAALPAADGGTNLLAWNAAAHDGGWVRWSPRPALAPRYAVPTHAESLLRVTGDGNEHLFGGWRRVVKVAALRPYRLRVEAAVSGIGARGRVFCQVRWLGPAVPEDVAPEYVAEKRGAAPGDVLWEEVLSPPPNAVEVEVSLLVQWAPAADVTFRAASLTPSDPVSPRVARVATVYWRPSGPSTPAANVAALAGLIDRAAATRPDLVLLSEAITSIGTGLSVPDAAQDPKGPAFLVLAAKAREHRTYVVYGAYEKAGAAVFNSAFVVGRDGSLAGSYRKVQVPVGEIEAGLSAGDVYAPLDLDFGRVGILICHDTAFDEPARILALAGAEILLAPAWGGDLTQIRARAMDNGLWVVTAGYDVPSAIIDPEGEVRAQTWKGLGDGVAALALDLSHRVRRPWVGDWGRAALKQRRTDAYGPLLEERR